MTIFEEVYRQEYDSAGNYHWWGVYSGHHVVSREEDVEILEE